MSTTFNLTGSSKYFPFTFGPYYYWLYVSWRSLDSFKQHFQNFLWKKFQNFFLWPSTLQLIKVGTSKKFCHKIKNGLFLLTGNLPSDSMSKSRVIFAITAFFCWIAWLYYNSQSLLFMTNIQPSYPFACYKDLLATTNYSIIGVKRSYKYNVFRVVCSSNQTLFPLF